ncbi:MAG: ferredoxin, partial [Bacteroidales bacterium]|nr:ferredoxin [Bacteroidales bacterium]
MSTHLNKIFFSPTGTTLKVLSAIESSLSYDATSVIDLTLKDDNKEDASVISAELTLIGLPVYSGRLPLEGLERFKQIQGNGAPAVLVVVYGNRHYDDALLELHNLAVEQGFKPLAAAAFIGEHTFSTAEQPLGALRPDALDLEQAYTFAKRIQQKLEIS